MSDASTRAKQPLGALPQLSSRQGAAVKVYLDFNGDTIANWGWNGKASPPQPYHPGTIPAYDSDGDATTFDDATEIPDIRAIWDTVAEKFSPFNVDVTTVDPGNLNDGQTFKMVIGGTNAWYGSGGGVAYVNSFTSTDPNVGFVFSQGRARDITFCGAGAAHEIGHAFGLEHQGITVNGTVTTEYSSGSGEIVPIMGNANNTPARRGVWFNGQANKRDGNSNLVALGPQDDLAIMTDGHNNFGYAGDDHAGDTTTITVTSSGAFVPARGIIERTTDVDLWRFSATTNRGTFTISSWANGGMLAPQATLTTASGNPVSSSAVYNNGTVTIETSSMTAGSLYQIVVTSKGAYSDIGQYQIMGQMQTFAAFDSSTGRLNINGVTGDNNLRLFMDYGTTTRVVVENTINGGTGSQSFDAWPINRIDVLLANGNDAIQIEPLANFAGGLGIPVTADLGGGNNTLKLRNYNGIAPFDVWASQATWQNNMLINFRDVNRLELLGGSGGGQFNIRETSLNTTVHAYGLGGDDTMTIFPGVVRSTGNHTYFYGNTGYDTLVVDASRPGDTSPSPLVGIIDDHVDTNAEGYNRESHFDTAVEAVRLIGGDGNELMAIYSVPATLQALSIDLGKGDDSILLGVSDDDPSYSTPFSDAVKAAVIVTGGEGNDRVYVDDRLALSSPGYGLTSTKFSSSGGGSVTYSTDVESLAMEGKQTAGCNYAITSTSANTVTTINAGNARDIVTVAGIGGDLTIDAGGGQDDVYDNGALITRLILRGGADSVPDFLSIDDRNIPANMSGGFVYADRVRRSVDWSTPTDIYYSGFSGVDWYQKNNQNLISVYGVSPDIGPNFQFWIGGGTADDYVELYPFNGQGNPTISGNLYFSGGDGPDTLRMFNNGSAPSNYRLFTQFGLNNVYIDGGGNRWTGAATTVENIALYGGSGNDDFTVEQFKSGAGLALYGGSGTNTCTVGNGNLVANITNISAFTFDGQSGTSTFVVDNSATTNLFNWRANDPSVTVSNSGGYFITMTARNIKTLKLLSGSSNDIFDVDAVASGVYTEIRGNGGLKWMRMGSTFGTVENIRGKVAFYPGAGGGYMQISDLAESTADTVHLTANSLGAFVGDNLFGAGGSLVFNNIVNGAGSDPGIYLMLSSGANTVYAQPLASARVTIYSHPFFASPSGSIKLALAGVSNPVISGDASAGSLTGGNRQTLSWNRFAGAIQSDNVAPSMVAANINLDGAPGFAFGGDAAGTNRQSLDVQFSEDVSGLLDPSWLQLTNLTTGATVPTANIAVAYVAATNTARFTFPGYSNGVLPDGNYSGRIFAGLPDFFGNALPSDAVFNFFFLMADANHDRKVDLTDFTILAANFNQSGRKFSQGDFNYDGFVDLTDFTFLAGNFNKTLAPTFSS